MGYRVRGNTAHEAAPRTLVRVHRGRPADLPVRYLHGYRLAVGAGSRYYASSISGVADEGLLPLLTSTTRPGGIAGILNDAVHLDVDGSLVVVCGPSAVRLPRSVVVATPLVNLVDVAELEKHAKVAVGAGCVQLADVAIEVRRWTRLPRPRLRDAAAAAVRSRHAASRVAPLAPPLDRRTEDLREALQTGDELAVQAAVAGLMGLGPGLTPLGDDVLVGAMLGLHAAGDVQGHSLVAAIRALRHRTTAVSGALLDAATTGRCIPQAAHFLAALDGGADLDTALPGLLAVGSTSGAGFATGIVLALQGSAITERIGGAA